MRKRIGLLAVAWAMITVSVPAAAQGDKSVPVFAYSDGGNGRFELTLSGAGVPSRDAIEGELLRRAAMVTRSRGHDWFVLLHMAGEHPGQHPPRANAAFGARYGHWQPHWSYKVGETLWQPWRPEWGTAFWTKEVDATQVQAFEAHAMIDLGDGPLPAGNTAFDARQVIRDLSAAPRKAANLRKRPSPMNAPAEGIGCR